jgi:septal ring factor EnvC (AmiA/AmiB activator)
MMSFANEKKQELDALLKTEKSLEKKISALDAQQTKSLAEQNELLTKLNDVRAALSGIEGERKRLELMLRRVEDQRQRLELTVEAL